MHDITPGIETEVRDGWTQDEYDMADRDFRSPQYATMCARSEAKRVLDLMKHLHPNSPLQTMAQIAFDLLCQIDDQLE